MIGFYTIKLSKNMIKLHKNIVTVDFFAFPEADGRFPGVSAAGVGGRVEAGPVLVTTGRAPGLTRGSAP